MDDRYERCFICDDPTHRSGEDSIYIGVSGIGPWCESCYADMVQEVQGDVRAEERALCNAANAPADPALLALDRELRIRNLIAEREFNTAAANRELAQFGEWRWDHDAADKACADAIARLLTPDGAASEGVTDGD